MTERGLSTEPGAGGTHVMGRQVLELTVAGREGARGLQDDLHRVVHGRLTSAMDRVLSRHSPAGEVIRLDRLELDLGRLSRADLEAELVARTEAELEKVLADELAALRRPAAGEPAIGRMVTAAARRLDALRHFLETGRLPWWAPSSPECGPEAVLRELLETAPGEVVRMLRSAAPSAAAKVARRLVRQFAPETRRRLLDAVTEPAPGGEVRLAVDEWERLLDDAPAELFGGARGAPPAFVADRLLPRVVGADAGPAAAPELSARLVEALVEVGGGTVDGVVRLLAVHARRVLASTSEVRLWLERRETRGGETPAARRASVPRTSDARPEPEEGRGAVDRAAWAPGTPAADAPAPPAAVPVPEAAERRQAATGDVRSAAAEAGAAGESLPPPARRAATADAPGEAAEPDRGRPERDPARPFAEPRPLLAPDEALYVDDAGLVLAAPYLPVYLGKIRLVEESAFVSLAAQERAVGLLRYLATGSAAAGEHLLALDKLLCGWPLDEPVAREIELTEEEEAESTDLLSSIIRNWNLLKSTSVDGLRASFLAREGRLTAVDQGWKLEVQRAGYDVLLDQLPWGISLALFPWMGRPLFVEW